MFRSVTSVFPVRSVVRSGRDRRFTTEDTEGTGRRGWGCWIAGVAWGILLLAGCDEKAEAAGTHVIALDTSGSATRIHEQMFNQVVEEIAHMPTSTRLIVYRFDSSPAEIFDGKPMADGAEAGKRLKPELQWQSKTKGTNLARLFERVDRSLAGAAQPVRVDVYTDCGTELMDKEDDRTVMELTEKWAQKGVRVRFVGVATGHREKLRDLVKCENEIE